jgi:hypothetical protein
MEENSRYTLPDIARRLDAKLHRVRYVVQEYRIEPAERIGIIRLWGDAQVDAIRAALRRTDQRRAGR